MKRYLITALLCLFALTSYCQTAQTAQPLGEKTEKPKAKKEKKQKTSKIRAPKSDSHIKETIYLFGFSTQIGDSLYYITSIAKLDSVDMTKKTRFLSFRDSYSYQMRVYVEGVLKQKSQTAAIFFDTKQKRIQKMYDKMITRYLNADGVKLITINPDEFTFTSVESGM